MPDEIRELLDELASAVAFEENDMYHRVPQHTEEVNRLAREIGRAWSSERADG